MRTPSGKSIFGDPAVRVTALVLGLWLTLRTATFGPSAARVGFYLELFLVATVLLLARTALARQRALQGEHARLESDLASLVHDFNNLIQIIVGFSAKILSGLSPHDPLRRDVASLRQTADRASALASQLLLLGARPPKERARVDLNATLAGVAPLLGSLAGERIDLRVHVDPAVAWVWADRGKVERAVLNLVVNAIDAMPRGGTLRLETHGVLLDDLSGEVRRGASPGHYAVLTVADSGVGMSDETRQRIFEPYFTTKPQGKGTGLGLSAVHAMMIEMGGYIDVQSQQGKGSRFRLLVPAAEPSGESPARRVSAVTRSYDPVTPRHGLASGGDPILPAEPFVS